MKNIALFALLSLLSLSACRTQKDFNHIVGATYDDHGCNSAAGYTWSNALRQCVRLWEVGERLESGTKTAFLIFNVDSTLAEIIVDNKSYLCKRNKQEPKLWCTKDAKHRISFNNGMKAAFVNGVTYSAEIK